MYEFFTICKMKIIPDMNVAFGMGLIFLVGHLHCTLGYITKQQFDITFKNFIHNTCFKRFEVTDAMRTQAKDGDIPYAMDFKCYAHCIFKTFLLLDKNDMIIENILVNFFPDSELKLRNTILQNCLPSPKPDGSHHFGCNVVYNFIHCCAKEDPMSLQYIPF